MHCIERREVNMSFCPGLSSKVRTMRIFEAQVIVIKKSRNPIFYRFRFKAEYYFCETLSSNHDSITSTDLGLSIVCVCNF